MALALISLLIWWWSSVATPAPRVALQPKVGVVLAELFAPGRVYLCTFIQAHHFSLLGYGKILRSSTTYLAGELSSSKGVRRF